MGDEKYTGLPTQQDIEKDISEYLARKYGGRIKIMGFQAQPEIDKQPPAAEPVRKDFVLDFHIRPEELIGYLDEYVVRQDQAKAILATKVCTHFNRIRYARARTDKGGTDTGHIKNNVLIIGPTGVGKTFLVKLIAKRLGVPFVKGDATKFSETGYVGGDVEDLVRDLVREADNDLEVAQYGIIYVDEIDKIASAAHRLGPDVSRSGVQRALLKPMEETEVDLKVPHDPVSQVEAIEHYRATGKRQRQLINTRNILFIMSGAFTDLEKIVKNRVQKQGMGFAGVVTSPGDTSRFLRQTKAEDLIEFGFESEFIGRLPVIANLDPLSVQDLYQILLNPNNSVMVGKKLDFRSYGIKIQFADDALLEIARQAHAEQTGARGLISILEKALLPFEKKLPSTDIAFLAVTLDLLLNPGQELKKLLASPDHQNFHQEGYNRLEEQEHHRLMDFILKTRRKYMEHLDIEPTPARLGLMARQCQEEILDTGEVCAKFCEMIKNIQGCANHISNRTGMQVSFSEEAIDLILARFDQAGDTSAEICRELLRVLEYGLDLLRQKKKLDPVILPASCIDAPEEFINNLVAERFRMPGETPEDQA